MNSWEYLPNEQTIMIKRIATRLIQTGIFKENNNGNSV